MDAMDEMSLFERIDESLKHLPMTWYPALLMTVIEGGYEAGTWRDGGASAMVRQKEASIDRDCGFSPPGGTVRMIHFEQPLAVENGDHIETTYHADGSVSLVLQRKDGTQESIKTVEQPVPPHVKLIRGESNVVIGAVITKPSPGEGNKPVTGPERHG